MVMRSPYWLQSGDTKTLQLADPLQLELSTEFESIYSLPLALTAGIAIGAVHSHAQPPRKFKQAYLA